MAKASKTKKGSKEIKHKGRWGNRISSNIRVDGVMFAITFTPHGIIRPFSGGQEKTFVDVIALTNVSPKFNKKQEALIRQSLEKDYMGKIMKDNGDLE